MPDVFGSDALTLGDRLSDVEAVTAGPDQLLSESAVVTVTPVGPTSVSGSDFQIQSETSAVSTSGGPASASIFLTGGTRNIEMVVGPGGRLLSSYSLGGGYYAPPVWAIDEVVNQFSGYVLRL